jgi:poly(A) polymerase
MFGFPGGVSYAILVANVCRTFPGLAPVLLINKFFKMYARWDWSVAVSINPDLTSVATFGEAFNMTVLTPVHPTMNSTHSVTETHIKVIV